MISYNIAFVWLEVPYKQTLALIFGLWVLAPPVPGGSDGFWSQKASPCHYKSPQRGNDRFDKNDSLVDLIPATGAVLLTISQPGHQVGSIYVVSPVREPSVVEPLILRIYSEATV